MMNISKGATFWKKVMYPDNDERIFFAKELLNR
jgi:hypothetical protein